MLYRDQSISAPHADISRRTHTDRPHHAVVIMRTSLPRRAFNPLLQSIKRETSIGARNQLLIFIER